MDRLQRLLVTVYLKLPRWAGYYLAGILILTLVGAIVTDLPASLIKGFMTALGGAFVLLFVLFRLRWFIPASIRREVQVRRESAGLLRESRKLLRRRGAVMETAAREAVEKACASLEEKLAVEEPDLEAMVHDLRELDELADKNLSFARKSTLREYAESIGVAILLALFLRTFVVEAFKIPSGSMIPTLMVGDHIFLNKYVYGIRLPMTYTKFFEWRKPERGEVIVFIKPSEPDKDYIKRIIGVAGDTVVVKDHVLTKIIPASGPEIPVELRPLRVVACDAEASDETASPVGRGSKCDLFAEGIGENWHSVLYVHRSVPGGLLADIVDGVEDRYVVPDGNVFCMGDNRDNSSDSRFWGDVPLDHVKGRAMVIWWSFGELWQRWHRFGSVIH
jgi:signal peptidase I